MTSDAVGVEGSCRCARWSSPFVETWTREKLPWATTPAVHSFEAFPPMERWPGLMAGYAAR